VTVNKKYTVSATYYINGNNYTVVDSATPRIKYNKDECDEPCYYVYNKVIDLRLKYTE
jgi:tartrate dehydratase beta subunit/fumarate hydratase class I family protein